MRLVYCLLALVFLPLTAFASELEKAYLPDRVLLVFIDDKQDRNFAQQNLSVGMAHQGLKQRDVAVLYIYNNYVEQIFPPAGNLTLNAYQLRNEYDVSDKQFSAVLVGRNGIQLHRKDAPIRPSELFTAVDKTPMEKEALPEED